MATDNLPHVPAETARRLLLGAQGLLDDPRRRATPEVVQELVERMGFVQVDSINAVERAHHLTLASRLDGYRPAMLERLLERERSLFEHWTHDASAVPTRWFPYWRHRFDRAAAIIRGHRWWQERLGPEADRVAAHVLERIAGEGPLMSRDFEHEEARNGPWWGWKPQKAALERLWHTGCLAVARRINFHKVYDLTERVFPAAAALPRPDAEEHLDWACRTALDRLGVATAGEIAGFWDVVEPRAAQAWCERAAAREEIAAVTVAGADGSRPRAAWAVAGWQERAERLPDPPRRLRLLSPFDPVLRERRRAQRLFGFDYRFEAFVPEGQRQYGYYVLPILEADRLVGRLDARFDRDAGVLVVRRVWWEPGVRTGAGRQAGLEAALARLARTIGAGSWTLP